MIIAKDKNGNPSFKQEDVYNQKYLKEKLRMLVHGHVYEDREMNLAYMYYNLKRNGEEFKWLKDNYGIGNPTDIPFIPFVKPVITTIVSMFLERDIVGNIKITCEDDLSIDKINEERKNYIINECVKFAKERMVKAPSKTFEEWSKNVFEYSMSSFKSFLEESAQVIIEYYINKHNLKLKFQRLLEHLLISGKAHYKVTINEIGSDVNFEVIDSRDIFYKKHIDEPFLNGVNCVVRRMLMTRDEAIQKFGHYMEEEDFGKFISTIPNALTYNELYSPVGYGVWDSMDKESYTINPDMRYSTTTGRYSGVTNAYPNDFVEVFHAEWIENVEVEIEDISNIPYTYAVGEESKELPKKVKRLRKDRMEGYLIGRQLAVNVGLSPHILRSNTKPFDCKLTYNGAVLDDFGKPRSFILDTKNLQDLYDIVNYMITNALAMSGVKTDTIVLEHIPIALDESFDERLKKYIGYRKQGTKIISISQEGVNAGTFNQYGKEADLSIDFNTIQAYQAMLQFYRSILVDISGITDPVRGITKERDAVNNVEVSTQKSQLITEVVFFLHERLIEQALTDIVNNTKYVYPEGFKGSYVLGDTQKIFNLKGDDYLSDYNIFIKTPNNKDIKDYQEFKTLALEAVKAGVATIDMVLELNNLSSVTKAKRVVKNNMEEQKENQLQQMQQQLEESKKIIEKLQKELEKNTTLEADIKKQEIALRKQENSDNVTLTNRKLDLEQEKIKNDKELKEKQILAERLQLIDDNLQNDEIKNI